jgi:hypothetical protein
VFEDNSEPEVDEEGEMIEPELGVDFHVSRAMNANALVCAVEYGVLVADEKITQRARELFVSPVANWQPIAVTMAALRTRSPIALSVLPLLKGICAMAFEVPYELSKAIGPNDAQCSASCPPASHSP